MIVLLSGVLNLTEISLVWVLSRLTKLKKVEKVPFQPPTGASEITEQNVLTSREALQVEYITEHSVK